MAAILVCRLRCCVRGLCRADSPRTHADLHMLLRNPLAVGHMVRHPPRASTPNVLPFSYSVPLGGALAGAAATCAACAPLSRDASLPPARGAPGMPSELFQLWPNRFYQEPDTLSSPTMQLNPCAMPVREPRRREHRRTGALMRLWALAVAVACAGGHA